MRPRVYLETSFVSYLTALPSRDLVTAAHQQITRDWWERRRSSFELFISPAVIRESSAGDPEAAARRLAVLQDIPVLDEADEAVSLAEILIAEIPLPAKAAVDALHVAVAVVHGMDYLLTWNCAHIANAALVGPIESICLSRDYEPPVICTPEQLLED